MELKGECCGKVYLVVKPDSLVARARSRIVFVCVCVCVLIWIVISLGHGFPEVTHRKPNRKQNRERSDAWAVPSEGPVLQSAHKLSLSLSLSLSSLSLRLEMFPVFTFSKSHKRTRPVVALCWRTEMERRTKKKPCYPKQQSPGKEKRHYRKACVPSTVI